MSTTAQLATVLGGVSLLLWGARMIRTGIMRGYGRQLQSFVDRSSASRLGALGAGTAAGTILQSSTAVAVLISPLAAHGAMTLPAALALMLGADVGAAFAAAILSIGIAALWPVATLSGYIVHSVFDGRNSRLKSLGRIMIGFGILLLGLSLISATAKHFSQSPIIIDIIGAASAEPVLAVLVGALLTWMAHSSIAIILLAISLVSAGTMPAEHLYAFVLGVNVGAGLPALSALASASQPVRRIPVGNLLFRTTGALLALMILTPAQWLIAKFIPDGGARIIAFHLLFNTAICILFLGFNRAMALALQRLMPDTTEAQHAGHPQYLDDSFLTTPSAALGAAAREILRMGGLVEDMLARTIEVFKSDDPDMRSAVEAADDDVDDLNDAIKTYLARLLREPLNDDESDRAVEMISYTTNLEHVGDIIDKNLMELALKKRRQRLQFSDEGLAEICELHDRVMETMHLSLNVFTSGQPDSARVLLGRKTALRSLELQGTQKHIERLRDGHSDSILTSAIHLDVLRDFKRINSHLTSIAYPVLERAGELRNTRLKKKAERQLQETMSLAEASNGSRPEAPDEKTNTPRTKVAARNDDQGDAN